MFKFFFFLLLLLWIGIVELHVLYGNDLWPQSVSPLSLPIAALKGMREAYIISHYWSLFTPHADYVSLVIILSLRSSPLSCTWFWRNACVHQNCKNMLFTPTCLQILLTSVPYFRSTVLRACSYDAGSVKLYWISSVFFFCFF